MVKELEEKFERSLKAVRRDLLIQDKKLARASKNAASKERSEGNEVSKTNLHDRKNSIDFSQTVTANALHPKLPFMK